jgi:hypothetical protein
MSSYNGLDEGERDRRIDESYNDRQHVSTWRRRWWGVQEDVGYRFSRLKCRLFDRHDVYCRGRVDHTRDQAERTR